MYTNIRYIFMLSEINIRYVVLFILRPNYLYLAGFTHGIKCINKTYYGFERNNILIFTDICKNNCYLL